MWLEQVLEWQNLSLKGNWSEAAQASFTVAVFWDEVLYSFFLIPVRISNLASLHCKNK